MRCWNEISVRPLFFHALAALCGIVAADYLGALSTGAIFGAITVAMVCACRGTRQAMWLPLLSAIAYGGLHHATLQSGILHPVHRTLSQLARSLDVVAEGRVVRALRADMPGDEPGEALFVADRVSCAHLGKEWMGPTWLRVVPEADAVLAPGRYRMEGLLKLPPIPDNPGQFDARGYYARLSLVAELRVARLTLIEASPWSLRNALSNAAEQCRQWAAQALAIDLEDRPKEKAIIQAMALGTVSDDQKSLEVPFRLSGTLHIFAVSGLHVAIFGAVLWALLRPLGMSRSVVVMVLIPGLFGYAFVTGLRPSAVRAAIMAALVLAGVGWNRRADLLNCLGAAALILLAQDSQQAFAPGFQLSFGVVVAITLFTPLFDAPLKPWVEPDPFLPKQLLTDRQRWAWAARRSFVGLFTVSAAAALGSLPLVFAHFHLVTPISLLANVVLVPLSFIILATAILTLGCTAIQAPLLAVYLNNANLAFAWGAIRSAEFFASIPAGNFYVSDNPSPWRADVELTVLRLPGGAAAQHLRVGNRHWLLDTGSERSFPYIVRPALQRLGVNRLHGLVLSHSDYEHVGAAMRVAEEFGQPLVWQPAREPWPWETFDSSLRKLHARGLATSPLHAGEALELGVSGGTSCRATVLYPTEDVWPRRSDDRSLVMRLDFGDFRILWCSDAGFLAEKTLLETAAPPDLRCDVLMRNQHASDYSLLPEFLNAAKPRIVITSNGSLPPEQRLSPRIVAECAQRKVILLDQGQTGAVTLQIWGPQAWLNTKHGETEIALPRLSDASLSRP
ncbi:MAG: ComEC/Rec2 family competence protein [Roseimicrobium sp.]